MLHMSIGNSVHVCMYLYLCIYIYIYTLYVLDSYA